MKNLLILALLLCFPMAAQAAATVGEPAPAFTATDSNGAAVSLDGLKGKLVVLEWTNSECPFVKKHYGSGNMQKLQKEAAGKGVVWISVNSSAAGKQGHVDAAGANALMKDNGAASAHYLVDADGTIGRLYDAKTTPHMFIIDKDGKLAYAGAIDSNASADAATIEGATNHVQVALSELEAGKPVTLATTKSYGCGVKYAN